MTDISASILNLDFKNLAQGIKNIELSGIDSFHMDVMDGHFVDNITFGPDVIRVIRELTGLPIFAHLMILNPEKFMDRFFKSGADNIIVHVETLNENNKNIVDMDNVGISLNPDISIESIEPYLEKTNRVLIMSVMAGFGGQEFIRESLDRISYVYKRKKELKLDYIITVDGGINYENACECIAAGADELAIGSYITKSHDPKVEINKLKSLNCEIKSN